MGLFAKVSIRSIPKLLSLCIVIDYIKNHSQWGPFEVIKNVRHNQKRYLCCDLPTAQLGNKLTIKFLEWFRLSHWFAMLLMTNPEKICLQKKFVPEI